jgi:hypothetical protein
VRHVPGHLAKLGVLGAALPLHCTRLGLAVHALHLPATSAPVQLKGHHSYMVLNLTLVTAPFWAHASLPGDKADKILASVTTYLKQYPFKMAADAVTIMDGACGLAGRLAGHKVEPV